MQDAKAAALAGEKSPAKDLLSLLVQANLKGDEKSRLTDEEVRGQVRLAHARLLLELIMGYR